MAKTKELLEELVAKVEDYGRTSMELYKLKAIQTTSQIAGRLASRYIYTLIMSMFILVLSIGISFWLGEVLGKVYYGFIVMSGFYLLVFVMLKAFAPKLIERAIRRLVIKELIK